jgi:hypothetical protein
MPQYKSKTNTNNLLLKVIVRDDESPIWLEELVGRINRLIPEVVPGSARITVGNIYTRTKGWL